MARITKPPEERRTELLNAAQRFFFEKSYEETSVEDITREVGVAKGTFYHYFKSKEDLLQQLAELLTARLLPQAQQIVDEPGGDAMEKLRALIAYFVGWKSENRDLTMAFVKVMYRDENLAMRERMTQTSLRTMAPLFGQVIRAGVDDGIFDVEDPEEAAEIVLWTLDGLSDRIAATILSMDEHPENFPVLEGKIRGAERAMGRVLGYTRGEFSIYDYDLVRKLFLGE